MKALAIDSSITQLTIAAKNNEHIVTGIYDIGMKQSDTLLSAIEYIMNAASLLVNDVDYLVFTHGPGSFTGLRLSLSALKAIALTTGAPLYGISTLDAYSFAYKNLPQTILCAIDAKKERFYAKAFEKNAIVFDEGDFSIDEISEKLHKSTSKSDILICGPDSALLFEKLAEFNKDTECAHQQKLYALPFCINPTDALFALAEEKIKNNESPLKDFDGPLYIRPSEAEVKAEGTRVF